MVELSVRTQGRQKALPMKTKSTPKPSVASEKDSTGQSTPKKEREGRPDMRSLAKSRGRATQGPNRKPLKGKDVTEKCPE